jgi:hypothetical protein
MVSPVGTPTPVVVAKTPTITNAPAQEAPKAPAPTSARDLNIH